MKHYKMFIDETGHPHKNHRSNYFSLVGIIIEDGKQAELKILFDQLRFKYWDSTNVVLHSEEIGRKVGKFSIFKNDDVLASKFQKQLLQLFHTAPIHVVTVVVDKQDAYKIGWKEDTIISKASESIVMNFLAFLYPQGAQGRIVYETSGSVRDSLYLKAFHRYLDPSWQTQHPEFTDVAEHLTSITFASKLNHDTEVQLADIFSYAAICHYKKRRKILTYKQESYENKLMTILEKKALLTPAGTTNPTKKKYYKLIDGMAMLPKLKPISKSQKALK